ncbi:MAG: NTP transferase domain-containing protein [Actinomycetota bacterium]|nr:NTP transferase domain-containing protein [Actinomycetota bacterium]
MGAPKALLRDDAGTAWVVRTAQVVAEAGCAPVVVVVGAAADDVRVLLDEADVHVVRAADWSEGMGASLRAGLRHLITTPGVRAALVCVVDTPDLDVAVVRRVAALAEPEVLARATYDGQPGHPVLLGARHFTAIAESARGDEGARGYLQRHGAVEVECADLAAGADVDRPEDLPPGHRLG